MVKVVLSNDQMKCCKTVLCPSKMLKENNWPVLNSGENFTSIIPFSSQLSCKVSIFLKMLNIKMSSIREIPFLLLRVPSLPRAARYLAQGRGTASEPGRAPHAWADQHSRLHGWGASTRLHSQGGLKRLNQATAWLSTGFFRCSSTPFWWLLMSLHHTTVSS